MDSPASSRGRGGPLRSRRGCAICRRRKIKCDEQQPSCGRCRRLKQVCEWPGEEQTLSERRRRAREPTAPKKILPNMSSTQLLEEDSSQGSSSNVGLSLPGSEDFINPLSTDVEEWLGCQDSIVNLNARSEDLLAFNPFDSSMNQDLSCVLDETFWSDLAPSIPSSLRNIWDTSKPNFGLPSPLDMMAPSFPVQCVALSPDFKFTGNEQRALHHYQHFYLNSQVTKRNAVWSTLGAILSLGASIPMVMHLLIATSLIYLAALYEYDPQISYVAQQHFRAGAQLLIKSLTDGSEPDHASILVAFHFTYCYMIKRKDVDPVALSQLSQAVLRHIESYDLDLYCAGKLPLEQATSSALRFRGLPETNRSFLARMIMWLYYEDAIGCSMGHGGALASHLTANKGRMRDIYQTSTTALESFWGEEYPVEEVIDDVENEAALEFLHEVWTCFQCLDQCYARSEVSTYEKDEVDQRIATLEQKFHSLSRLASATTHPRTQLLKNADFGLAYYHALLIFRHRHELSLNRSLAPLPPSAALTPLLTIVQRTFATDPTVRERYMWPLFLAGIETEDPIHHEWISGKIEDQRMGSALQQIWNVQSRMGRRLEMRVVKKLLNGKELAILPVV